MYGVTPYVIAPAPCTLTRILLAQGVETAILPQQSWFRSAIEEGAKPSRAGSDVVPRAAQQEMQDLLEKWDVQVVYSNSAMIDTGIHTAKLTGLPHVWHLREFGDLDYGREPSDGWSAVHHTIAQSNKTISVSNAIRRHFLGKHDSEHDHVVYNGVATVGEYDRRRSLRMRARQRRQTPYIFVQVGRIMDAKGQFDAVEALAKLKPCPGSMRLRFVGGGDSSVLRRQVASLGVEHLVRFYGYIDNPLDIVLSSNAALMCSHAEAFGRVTAEAMSVGLPVIGNDAGATPEIIQHEHNGLLYPGDVDGLADCMERMAGNPALGRQLGDAGWVTARARYSIEACAAGVWDILRNLLTANRMGDLSVGAQLTSI